MVNGLKSQQKKKIVSRKIVIFGHTLLAIGVSCAVLEASSSFDAMLLNSTLPGVRSAVSSLGPWAGGPTSPFGFIFRILDSVNLEPGVAPTWTRVPDKIRAPNTLSY